MRLQADRITAGAIAVALNVLIAWLLVTRTGSITTEPARSGGAIQIVWIEAAVQPTKSPNMPSRTRRNPDHARTRSVPKPVLPGKLSQLQVVDLPALANEAMPPVTDDQWDLPASVDIIPPSSGASSFQRNPFAETPPPLPATERRLDVTVVDNSFGGRMQRMARSATCRELRRALRTSSQSTEAILQSMQRAGCDG